MIKIIDNFFNNYYKHYNCENILDRAPWGHPEYYNIIKPLPDELYLKLKSQQVSSNNTDLVEVY